MGKHCDKDDITYDKYESAVIRVTIGDIITSKKGILFHDIDGTKYRVKKFKIISIKDQCLGIVAEDKDKEIVETDEVAVK